MNNEQNQTGGTAAEQDNANADNTRTEGTAPGSGENTLAAEQQPAAEGEATTTGTTDADKAPAAE